MCWRKSARLFRDPTNIKECVASSSFEKHGKTNSYPSRIRQFSCCKHINDHVRQRKGGGETKQ